MCIAVILVRPSDSFRLELSGICGAGSSAFQSVCLKKKNLSTTSNGSKFVPLLQNVSSWLPQVRVNSYSIVLGRNSDMCVVLVSDPKFKQYTLVSSPKARKGGQRRDIDVFVAFLPPPSVVCPDHSKTARTKRFAAPTPSRRSMTLSSRRYVCFAVVFGKSRPA